MDRAPLLYPQPFPFFWKQILSPALLTKCHCALVNKAAGASFLILQAWGILQNSPGSFKSLVSDSHSLCPPPLPTSQGEVKPKLSPKLSCPRLPSALASSSGGRRTGEIRSEGQLQYRQSTRGESCPHQDITRLGFCSVQLRGGAADGKLTAGIRPWN